MKRCAIPACYFCSRLSLAADLLAALASCNIFLRYSCRLINFKHGCSSHDGSADARALIYLNPYQAKHKFQKRKLTRSLHGVSYPLKVVLPHDGVCLIPQCTVRKWLTAEPFRTGISLLVVLCTIRYLFRRIHMHACTDCSYPCGRYMNSVIWPCSTEHVRMP